MVQRHGVDGAERPILRKTMSRPAMRFVPVKTVDQQAALMLAGQRGRLVRERTWLANTIRGQAAEFGRVAPAGPAQVAPLLTQIRANSTLPTLVRDLVAEMADEFAQPETRAASAGRAADGAAPRQRLVPPLGQSARHRPGHGRFAGHSLTRPAGAPPALPARSAVARTCKTRCRWWDRSIHNEKHCVPSSGASTPRSGLEPTPRKPSWPAAAQAQQPAGHKDASNPTQNPPPKPCKHGAVL